MEHWRHSLKKPQTSFCKNNLKHPKKVLWKVKCKADLAGLEAACSEPVVPSPAAC